MRPKLLTARRTTVDPTPVSLDEAGSIRSRHEVVFCRHDGSLTGAKVDGGALGVGEMLQRDFALTLNAQQPARVSPIPEAPKRPLLGFSLPNDRLGQPYAFVGHTLRVLSRNGVPSEWWRWQDTVLVAPREHVETTEDWLLHCHVLELRRVA